MFYVFGQMLVHYFGYNVLSTVISCGALPVTYLTVPLNFPRLLHISSSSGYFIMSNLLSLVGIIPSGIALSSYGPFVGGILISSLLIRTPCTSVSRTVHDP
jgi:hypothetical protein